MAASFEALRESSGASKGITCETALMARMVVVAFAGPLRGCGLLLIVEHRDRYYSLLTDLERPNVGIGRHVRAEDSVSAMEHRNIGNLSLYMELRNNGHAINPLPWLAAGKRKVSG